MRGRVVSRDAAQGVEAQTVANVHLAHKQGLTIVPIINKIDLPNADVAAVRRQLEEILAIPAEEAIEASAKMGIGIEKFLSNRNPDSAPARAGEQKLCARWCLIPCLMFTAAWLAMCAWFREQWKRITQSC